MFSDICSAPYIAAASCPVCDDPRSSQQHCTLVNKYTDTDIDTDTYIATYIDTIAETDTDTDTQPHKRDNYGVALVTRIDKIIGLFCKRAL